MEVAHRPWSRREEASPPAEPVSNMSYSRAPSLDLIVVLSLRPSRCSLLVSPLHAAWIQQSWRSTIHYVVDTIYQTRRLLERGAALQPSQPRKGSTGNKGDSKESQGQGPRSSQASHLGLVLQPEFVILLVRAARGRLEPAGRQGDHR